MYLRRKLTREANFSKFGISVMRKLLLGAILGATPRIVGKPQKGVLFQPSSLGASLRKLGWVVAAHQICETPGQRIRNPETRNSSKKTSPRTLAPNSLKKAKHTRRIPSSSIFGALGVFFKEFGVGARGVISEFFFSRSFGFQSFGFL